MSWTYLHYVRTSNSASNCLCFRSKFDIKILANSGPTDDPLALRLSDRRIRSWIGNGTFECIKWGVSRGLFDGDLWTFFCSLLCYHLRCVLVRTMCSFKDDFHGFFLLFFQAIDFAKGTAVGFAVSFLIRQLDPLVVWICHWICIELVSWQWHGGFHWLSPCSRFDFIWPPRFLSSFIPFPFFVFLRYLYVIERLRQLFEYCLYLICLESSFVDAIFKVFW